MNKKDIRFVFFGTPHIAVVALEALKQDGMLPHLVVTAPDKKAGRGMRMQSPPVKECAEENKISVVQPQKLDDDFIKTLEDEKCDVFVIVAYGKIVPQRIIDIPTHGVLNMHPSLLPKHRGPSPIESQILSDDEIVGVTIMRIDEKMDHGPILAQEIVPIDNWPTTASHLEEILGGVGAKLLAETLPEWVAENIDEQEQEHSQATYCNLIKKEDALIDLSDDPRTNYLKFLAYEQSPRAYFFTKSGKRAIITDAAFEDGKFVIRKVIPEGKKEVLYQDFLRTTS